MESLVDTEEWMRWSALEHASGDWDSYVTAKRLEYVLLQAPERQMDAAEVGLEYLPGQQRFLGPGWRQPLHRWGRGDELLPDLPSLSARSAPRVPRYRQWSDGQHQCRACPGRKIRRLCRQRPAGCLRRARTGRGGPQGLARDHARFAVDCDHKRGHGQCALCRERRHQPGYRPRIM